MNLKGFFTVILKVFAIYLAIKAIVLIPEFLGAISFLVQDTSFWSGIFYALGILLTLILYFFIARLLIIKTDWVVSKIIRDDRLEVEFTTFKVHRSVILSIAVIMIGGLTLVNEIPNFIGQLYSYNSHHSHSIVVSSEYLVVAFVKILIGLYLVYYNKLVVSWIEKKRK